MKSSTMFVNVGFAIVTYLCGLTRSSNACNCIYSEPEVVFCKSNFVAHISITSNYTLRSEEEGTNGSPPAYYTFKVVNLIKVGSNVTEHFMRSMENTDSHGVDLARLYTTQDSCAVTLQPSHDYIIAATVHPNSDHISTTTQSQQKPPSTEGVTDESKETIGEEEEDEKLLVLACDYLKRLPTSPFDSKNFNPKREMTESDPPSDFELDSSEGRLELAGMLGGYQDKCSSQPRMSP